MGVPITGTFTRGANDIGQFLIVDSNGVPHHYRRVASTAERDAIEEYLRVSYMLVYSIADNKTYRLGSDTTIAGQVWTEESGNFIPLTQKGAADGVAPLNSSGKIDIAYLDTITLSASFAVADITAMLALTTYTGNIIVVADASADPSVSSGSASYVKKNDVGSPTLTDFLKLEFGASVLSVNGLTGAVSIDFSALLAYGSSATQFASAISTDATITGIQGNVSTNAGNISTLDSNKADKSNVLGLDNIASYTPTTTYHPATKKYVDDAVISIGALTDAPADTSYYTRKNNTWVNIPLAGLSDYPTDAIGVLTNDGAGNLSWAVGGGSSSGSNNEVQTSDGSGGFVASKLFFDETTGTMTLGDGTLGGSSRSIIATGSAATALYYYATNGHYFYPVSGSSSAITIKGTSGNSGIIISGGASDDIIGGQTSSYPLTISTRGNAVSSGQASLQLLTASALYTNDSSGNIEITTGAPNGSGNAGDIIITNNTTEAARFKNAGIQLSGDTTQTIKTIHYQLSQSEIQSLNTTPITLITAPGSGKMIQIIGGSEYYNHNGTSYSGATSITMKFSSGGDIVSIPGISAGADYIINFLPNSLAAIVINDSIILQANANSTGAGGTIDIYVQYVIIDTN